MKQLRVGENGRFASAPLWGRFVVLVALGALASISAPSHAHGYTFGEPFARATGAEQTVFDYSTTKCATWDIPDQSARAFKDDQNRVQLIDSHYSPRRKIGPDLNSVVHQCTTLLHAARNSDPAKFDDLEWIWSPYTLDGRTVYALVHEEFRGWDFAGRCGNNGNFAWPVISKCWYNSFTWATSTNSGDSYSHATAPAHFLAGTPYRYDMNAGPAGVFQPSQIVRHSDGYYYTLFKARDRFETAHRTCVMRTNTLTVPGSWRAWDGEAFTVRFINPYVETPADPTQHSCAPLTREHIVDMSDSLVWSDYLQKYVLLGVLAREPGATGEAGGIYYSLSDDLVHWSSAKRLMAAEIYAVTHQCGEPNPIRDPSLIDPASTSRNFETIGRRAYLYFTRFNMSGSPCSAGADRDLIRIPIEFTGSPPTASMSASPNPALPGQRVTFDGSASTDSGGSIVKYQWDLDGDGFFEWNNNAPAQISPTFDEVRSDTVGLRVTDNEGLTDEVHIPFKVEKKLKMNVQPTSAPIPSTYAKDTGAPYSDARGFGWVRQNSLPSSHTPVDMTPNTRDRDAANTDQYGQELDTFVYMQFPGTNQKFQRVPGAWEMSVPCGTYAVKVSVGDSSYSSSNQALADVSTHRINVEGQNAIAGFSPTDSNKFASATAVVPVCDGRLTVDAIGGTNTKLNYVEVELVDPKINFQPSGAPIPASYAKDAGAAYNVARGLGWVRQDSLSSSHTPLNLTPNTRDRDLANTDQYDQRLDTFIYMQFPGTNQKFQRTPGAFEIAVPCRTYSVTVSVGDSSYSSSNQALADVSTHRINVEGQTAIAGFNPTDSNKFASATRTVSVCDGRLTIDAIGGVNTKLNYIDVVTIG